jgi:hypothetical protein
VFNYFSWTYNDCHITNMEVTQFDASLRANSLSSVFSPEFRFTKEKTSMKKEQEANSATHYPHLLQSTHLH